MTGCTHNCNQGRNCTCAEPPKYKLHAPPKYVGKWVLPGSHPQYKTWFAVMTKPNWLHRTMMNVLMGWTWEDEK